MKQPIPVSGAKMPHAEWYIGNRENHLLRAFEPEPGIFIAESKNVIEIALGEGYEPIHGVCTRKMAQDTILEQLQDIPVYLLEEEDAKGTFGYVLTGGISCAMRRKNQVDYREILKNARRIVVLENIENPTNVGAIFRTAAALGVDAILLSPACADPLYRRAIRVSVGNVFHIPWAYIEKNEWQWQKNGVALLKQEGFCTVALALREDNIFVDDVVLHDKEKVALILGNEGEGLCNETIANSDYVAKIPMREGVDSLNVSVAAAIAMWELSKG